MRIPSYNNELLNLAEDLARRMLPAFDTPTGMSPHSLVLLNVLSSVLFKFLGVVIIVPLTLFCSIFFGLVGILSIP